MILRDPDPVHEPAAARLNLLLSSREEDRSAALLDQLVRLLEPMGIRGVVARSVEEAEESIRRLAIHIALVDLQIPLRPGGSDPAGGRVLQLLRRLDPAPPTVILRPPQPAARESARGLAEALRDGAFAVVDRPARLETLLEVMRRVLRRHYADNWPSG